VRCYRTGRVKRPQAAGVRWVLGTFPIRRIA
jgi:hypothetical protein